MINTVDDLVIQLTNELGDDIVYITAEDHQRHLDLATIAFSFSSLLFLAFFKGFMDAAQKDFEKYGKEAYTRLKAMINTYIDEGPSEDPVITKQQKNAIDESVKATKVLIEQKVIIFSAENVAKATSQVDTVLDAYHLDRVRKQEISESVRDKIVMYLNDDSINGVS